MNLKTTLAAALLAIGGVGSAYADAIPYPCCGPNPAVYSFAAAGTQDLIAYFYSSDAAYTESLGVIVNGIDRGTSDKTNHSSPHGYAYDFGAVTAGQTVVFYIVIDGTTPVIKYFSTPGINADGFNHDYTTPYTGGVGYIPVSSGTYLSFEDLPHGGDMDYNDTSFVVTNVRLVPEPTNVALLLAGAGLVGFMARRRRQ